MKTGLPNENECDVPVWQFQTIQRLTHEVGTMVLEHSDTRPAHSVSKSVMGFEQVILRGYSYGCRCVSGV